MTKRLLFHFLNFAAMCAAVMVAVGVYFKLSYVSLNYAMGKAYDLVAGRWDQFTLIVVITYLLGYLSGLIKYTMEDRYFRMPAYFKEIFKLFLIVVFAVFVEFLIYYESTRIGRSIYVYFFILYSLYYLVYFWARCRRGPRLLLWMNSLAPGEVLDRYLATAGEFRVIETDGEREDAGLNAYVIYKGGDIDEKTSEGLIKSKLAGYTVMDLVELIEKETGRIPLDYVNIHWFLEKFDVVDRNYFRSNRMFSMVLSIVFLILLFPLGMLAALVHRLFSRGPLFFTQERVGLHGKHFKLIKFRTMVANAEEEGARFAEKNDGRITRLGKLMRRFRIDEIPQFVNVLKGDMSIVGPRPERRVFVDSLSKDIPYYRLRLLVPPGLTGWAQINGAYAGSDVGDHKTKLEYDLYYIKNRSIFMEMLILLRTVGTILRARGE